MNISFIIPNFNGEQLLRKNLPKILEIAKKYKNGKAEIVIADDSSKDNSIAFLNQFIIENKANNITVLENSTGVNKGFATNVNKAVLRANGDIVILLNTDVLPEKDFLAPLLSHFVSENVFAVGCLDKSIENGKTILRGRGIGRWRRGFLVHKAGEIGKNTTTLWVSGGSSAFRKSIWEKLGGLEELYDPFYWEDIDLSYKAKKAGYGVLFEEKSIVVHEHAIGSIQKNYSPFFVKQIAYRNQFFFTWMNATDKIILVQHFFFIPVFFIKAVLRKDVAFLLGFFNALSKLPKVLGERQKVQRLVKESDKNVIESLN